MVTSAAMLNWQNQATAAFTRIDGEVLSVIYSLDNVLRYAFGLRRSVARGESKTAHVKLLLQQLVDNFVDREPDPCDSGDARQRFI